MTTTSACAKCGGELPIDAPEGLCPKCLVIAGLMSQIGTPTPETVDFSPSEVIAQAHTPAASQAPVVPRLFGGYRIIRPLGKGGMGTVYEAEEDASGRRLALKVLAHSLDSEQARTRFFREGRLAASVNHPNSVYIFGTEEINELPVITMELAPGGTLQELVKNKGPLPIAEAVDTILQIITGLEAAAAAGVLHRDVKPSNCFIDPDGTVKVGDFGLSISTLARHENNVTTTGAVLGTPAYASPEQLRGDEIDARSDQYAVGVTLYFLLTGQTPFTAGNMVKLLATVLERPAESPKKLHPEIPEDLANVVLRCLAKQPAQRFKNYEELRLALLPFTSGTITPAPLSTRFLASILDSIFQALINMTFLFLVVRRMTEQSHDLNLQSTKIKLLNCVSLALTLLYFALLEGYWGASLGKAIWGLRVVDSRRSVPGFPRALLRSAIFLLLPIGVSYLLSWLFSLPTTFSFPRDGWRAIPPMALVLAIYLLPVYTMRRSNGYAGLHDLISGTRVISKRMWQSRPAGAAIIEAATASEGTPRVGPYHVLAELDSSDQARLFQGYDDRLFRKVWIRQLPDGAPEVAPAMRMMGRRGRQRWLGGKRAPGENWDAYESLAGQPLTALLHERQTWKQARFWLLDLAEELDAGLKDQSLPAMLALDRVWITTDGRAKLLDFAAPGAATRSSEQPAPVSDRDAQLFLKRVAIAAMEGRETDHDELTDYAPKIPMPLHARGFIANLPKFSTFDGLIDQLRELVNGIGDISRARRLALWGGCILPVALLGIPMFLIMIPAINRAQNLKPLGNPGFAFLYSLSAAVLTGFLIVGLPAMVATFFGGGVLMRGLGLAIVTSDGSPSSRGRALWRAFITWSPVLWIAIAPLLLIPALRGVAPWLVVSTVFAASIPVLLFVASTVWSVCQPDRGMQDWLAGDRLVPR